MATAIETAIEARFTINGQATESKTQQAEASKKKEIKYSDKSAGQPKMVIIFNIIKSMMKPYARGTIKERGEKPGIYNLVSEKQIETAGRKFDEIYLASIIVQKGYVGFYYPPAYTIDGSQTQLKAELLKCLKGKSCFHIKKNDRVIMEQIKEALEIGYKAYKEKGWVG